jgi:hypothetical protein
MCGDSGWLCGKKAWWMGSLRPKGLPDFAGVRVDYAYDVVLLVGAPPWSFYFFMVFRLGGAAPFVVVVCVGNASAPMLL